MKVIILIASSLMFCSLIILSCQSFALKASDNSPTNEISIPISDSNSEQESKNNIKNDDLDEFIETSPNSFIILGYLSASDNKIELDGDFWGHEENEEEAKLYPDNKIEIDIMNCAGYLASATTTYTGVMRKVKLIPETIAPDAAKKIRQCSPELKGKIVASDVFGIAPRVEKRRNIKINKIDTKKLYDSLAKDIAAIKKVEKAEEDNVPQIKGTKGNLRLRDDNWTDLDGDGQIDLIKFHDTPCDNEKDTCTWIFRLINDKWKEVDYVYPL